MKKALIRFLVDFEESARIALEQLRVHKMRSLLTALGVIIGVWAVILIGVGINGLDTGFRKSLDMLGPNHFYVERWPWRDVGDDWHLYRSRPNMEAQYAERLNEIIANTPNTTLVMAVPTITFNRTLTFGDRRADRISMTATTSEFGYISTAEVDQGRFFTAGEQTSAQNVIVLGSGVVAALFPDAAETAVGQRVSISGLRFTVIGTLQEQGAFLGMQSFDNQAIIPLSVAQKYFTGRSRWINASIRVVKHDEADRDLARDEIIGAMRRIRGILPDQPDNFEVNASDAIENTLGPVKTGIAVAGFVITGLALFVGAIGIMNITFVSVKERTREIGTRRAIGARRSSILTQFLLEAVSICLLGGATGLLLAFGSKMALDRIAPNFPSSFSVDLMILAFVLSVLTGVFSGFAPAWKAAQLDPATALRHE